MGSKALLPATVILLVACGADPAMNSAYNASGFDVAKDEASRTETRTNAAQPQALILTEANVDVLPDSLRSADDTIRRRWASAITATWPHADGALSEALSTAGLAYAQAHPKELIDLIGSEGKAQWTWADLISGELIIADVEPFDSFGQFFDGMTQLCQGCTPSDRDALLRLQAHTRHRLSEKLK